MDPLSISASLVSFLAFSGNCARWIRKLLHDAAHAPTEIVALSNELSDLNVVVNDIEATRQSISRSANTLQLSPDFTAAVDLHLSRARSKIRILQDLLQDVFMISPKGSPTIQKYKWVRKKSTALAIIKDLADIKRDLGVLLSSIAAARTVHIELSLASIRAGLPPVETEISENFNESNVSGQRRILESVVQNDFTSINTRHETSVDRATSTLLETVRQIGQFATLTLQLHRVVKCDGECSCACHSRKFIHSPQALHRIFGTLFVGYAGLPVWTGKCDVTSCTNQYVRAMQVSYSFPSWFLARTVDMVFGMTQMSEPAFGLKVRNRVKEMGENNIFQLARAGDQQGIKRLFERRLASPNDLTFAAGNTPIHFAVELGKVEAIQFLIDAGVNPYTQDDHGNTDALIISSNILCPPKRNPQSSREFEAVFSKLNVSHEEIWDFTFLHRVVVGDLHVSLEEALGDPRRRADINALDLKRRTPLIWAAHRGDDSAVKLLLQAGANVQIIDDFGTAPIHAAVNSGNFRCVELLLIAGCNIHVRDAIGQTPLHIATWAIDDPAFLEAIVLAGASVNCANRHNESALQSAACLNHHRNGAYLIRMGADMENRDSNGDTPLLEAMRYGCPDMLKVLLSSGAKVDYVNKSGETILHVAAIYGTTECVDILSTYELIGLDANARDKQGKTAKEAFEDRVAKPDGLGQVIGALFDRFGLLEDEAEETFWDAQED